MLHITQTTPKNVTKALGRKAVTSFWFFDSPGDMARAAMDCGKLKQGTNWDGGLSPEEAVKRATFGDMARVSASEALLSKMEKYAFESNKRTWRNDLAGGCPDVPAFIAGQPLSMRRRTIVESDSAPLAIIVDLTASEGIPAEIMERRGAAILALVRVLSTRRPVELWAGSFLQGGPAGMDACAFFARIDTAPLDLARAAHVLSSQSMPRQIGFALGYALGGFQGRWPYVNDKVSRPLMKDIFLPAMPHVTDALCVPGAHLNDPMSKNPEAWLEETLNALEAGETLFNAA
jgi:hypothetical protein